MPLFPPRIDTLRWDDLVRQGRAQLPLVAPEWTDQNTSDTGIAVLELLSWFIEAEGYRSSAVTDRERRLLLALAGYSPRPAQPATCLVRFSVTAGGALPFTVPGGLEMVGMREGESLPLTLLDSVAVSGATVAAVASAAATADADGYRTGCADLTSALAAAQAVEPFGPDPAPGDCLLVGLAPAAAALPAAALDFWLVSVPGLEAPESPAMTGLHHSARSVWEFWDGTVWVTIEGAGVQDDAEAMRSGRVRLMIPAVVPAVHLGDQNDGALAGRRCCWLRCRLTDGLYDAAPRLSAVHVDVGAAVAAQVYSSTLAVPAAATVSGAPTPGSPLDEAALSVAAAADGVLTLLQFDPVTSTPSAPVVAISGWTPPAGTSPGRLSADVVVLGTASGIPGETFTLPQRACHAQPGLWVIAPDGSSQPVRMLRDLAGAGPGDLAAQLDDDAVTIRVGDGRTGRTLPAGSTVLATGRFTVGAGLGEIHPPLPLSVPNDDRSRRLLGAGAATVQAQLVDGLLAGSAAEDTSEVAARAERALWVHDRLTETLHRTGATSLDELPLSLVRRLDVPERAVTGADLERLSLATAGTALWRARALPEVDPRLPGLRADGCVTVVVVPHLPLSRPQPTAGLLAAVRARLEATRTLGTRVFVVGPDYVTVGVAARLVLFRGADRAQVAEAASAAVRAFLHPVTGGSAGCGWPFGRTVRRTELLQLLDSVTGVDRVEGLELRREPSAGSCGDVAICPTQLVIAGTVNLSTEAGR